jgi:hypothetical protein
VGHDRRAARAPERRRGLLPPRARAQGAHRARRFFDINPGRERSGPRRYAQWMRFSFGPPRDNLELGLDRLAALVDAAR